MLRSVAAPFVLAAFAFLAQGCGPSSGDDAGGGAGGDGDQLECGAGLGDCDGDPGNGCERRLDTATDCGQCGLACDDTNALSASCTASGCELDCVTGFADCDGDPSNGCEADLNSHDHCGGCFNYCSGPNAEGTCNAGACEVTCTEGYGDCNVDAADGCESEMTSDQSCGACGVGCSGVCDTEALACAACDEDVALDSDDPLDAARAMGLCADVVSAQWVYPDGSAPAAAATFALGYGNLDGFGPNVTPRNGLKLLGLSSGTARQPIDPGFQSPGGYSRGYTTAHPEGFPKESAACPGVTTGTPYDGVGLEVELQVPEWAEGLSFDFTFYTFEWPGYICSVYNDFFVALLDPIPEGQADGNISFDAQGNPISVNNALLAACGCAAGPPCSAGGKVFDCPAGTAELEGTGFESHAATGWLTTTAPVEPGSTVRLRLAVYDSGDGILDSTALIDNFHWLPEPPDVETNPVE